MPVRDATSPAGGRPSPVPTRTTVNLGGYPDLVVIYLGLRARSLRGLVTMLGLRKEIRAAVAAGPDGLLCHEDLTYSVFPVHRGMRQYWRDFESMERWTRSMPAFAPQLPARGAMFSARRRAGRAAQPGPASVVPEDDLVA